MSRIITPNRHMRHQKQSMLFSSSSASTSGPTSDVTADVNSNTISVPQNFTTVSVDQNELTASVQNINTNASHRDLSEHMYEYNNDHVSNYKNNVILNMQREVLEQAKILCQGEDNRSYESQVSQPLDTSYGAHKLNMIAAQNIVSKRKPKA